MPVGVVWYLCVREFECVRARLSCWNSTSNPGAGTVVDPPNIGFYDFNTNQTFREQKSVRCRGAGISFAIVSSAHDLTIKRRITAHLC